MTAKDFLLDPDFTRRLRFMLEPLLGKRFLPSNPDAREALLQTARDWLDRFVDLLSHGRKELLDRALDINSDQDVGFPRLNPAFAPIEGWDLAENKFSANYNEQLFDQEIVERTAYVASQILESDIQPFSREAAFLTVDRLDLLITLVQNLYPNPSPD